MAMLARSDSEREFLQTLSASQLRSVFTVGERDSAGNALAFLMLHVEFLFPIHAAAVSRGLQERDNFTTALLNLLCNAGAFHTVVRRMLAVPRSLRGESAEGGGVLGGLLRLYALQQGLDWCRAVLAEPVLALATTTEELAVAPLPDLEADQARRVRLDNLVKTLANCVASDAAVAAMPRGLRATAALLGDAGEARRLLLERLVLPALSAAADFGLLGEDEARRVTPAGRASLASAARLLLQAARASMQPLLESLGARAAEGNWEAEERPAAAWERSCDDGDASFVVATMAECCAGVGEALAGRVPPELLVEYEEAVSGPLRRVASEWGRRTRLKETVGALRAGTARCEGLLAGLESLLGARPRRELHEALAGLRERAQGLRTFLLLAAKQLNKRAHPTQWQLHGGGLSDLLRGLATFHEPYVALRHALKAAVPLVANKILEEELRIGELLAAYEQQHGRDLVEQATRELASAAELVKGLRQCAPEASHKDAAAFAAATEALERQLELIERGEIESLLRTYKFQKYTVSGWKLVPRSVMGGSLGICSSFRRHCIAGLVLHGSPKPTRFFAQLFSDVLILLSQIELAPVRDEGEGSPRLGSPRVRAGSLRGSARLVPKVGSKERKRVLHRMASEATLAKAATAGLGGGGRAPLLFRIEKVLPLGGVTVELQMLNRGFAVDGFEFTVEGPRETLLRWFAALRGCEVGRLVDTADARAGAGSTGSAGSGAGEEGAADEDILRMMEEFYVFGGGGSMVVRGDGEEGEGASVVQQVLAAALSPAPAVTSLVELFLPPPNVVPVRIRQRTGSVIAGPEAEEEEPATELAAMLKSAKWTIRLLRETACAE